MVDEWTPFGGAFLLLIHFALTYTFVYKYSAHRSEKVTRKAPNLYLQVCGYKVNPMRSVNSVHSIVEFKEQMFKWLLDGVSVQAFFAISFQIS